MSKKHNGGRLLELGIKFSPQIDPEFQLAFSPFRRWAIFLSVTSIISVIAALFTEDPLFCSIFFIILLPFLLCFVSQIRNWLSVMPIFAALGRTFAKDNQYSFDSKSKPNYPERFEPSIAKTGIWERKEQIIAGEFDDYQFKTYIYTTRHPFAYRVGRIATRVYEVKLPKAYPHVFLATKRPKGTRFATNFNRHFDDDQRIGLEGDFDKYFITYTHRRTATDALTILAPNVMMTIIDANQTYNLEIIGDHLYLYSPDYTPTEENFTEAFTILHKLLKHFNSLNKTMKFVLPNDKKYPYLRSVPGFGTAYFGGKYFNRSIAFILFYDVYSLIRIVVMDQSKTIKYAQFTVVIVSTVVMIAALLVFRKKYKNSL